MKFQNTADFSLVQISEYSTSLAIISFVLIQISAKYLKTFYFEESEDCENTMFSFLVGRVADPDPVLKFLWIRIRFQPLDPGAKMIA